MISRRSALVAGTAALALAMPAGADAHPAYVDAEFAGTPSFQCADINAPCTTIAAAIPFVEPGLAVVVDDSASPYLEQLVTDWPPLAPTPGGVATITAGNFAAEPAAGPTEWTIDGETGTAVTVPAGESTTVAGFGLRGNAGAVTVNGAATLSNGSFDDPQAPPNGDVQVLGSGSALIVANEFEGGDAVAPNTAVRVGGAGASASLSRNLVSGYASAVDVGTTTGTVTLSGDLLFDNPGTGLDLDDEDLGATNVTLWGNGTDVSNSDSHLTLDSSIVEDQIVGIGAATCEISFSRGPATNPCGDFQTSADPAFVDPPGNDFHLLAGSPMIDAGNPTPPAASRDFDGDLRTLDGDGDGACPPERDIGADEFAGTILDCSPPAPQPLPQPGDAVPPETLIESGPSPRTKSTSASFTFSSSEPGSAFECRLDSGSFQSCASPQSLKVRRGRHTLDVRAKDAAGNLDPTPASWNWNVKKKKRRKG